MKAHLPVYIHWSVGWPEKRGRNYQHRIHPHLLLSPGWSNQDSQNLVHWVQCLKNLLLKTGDPAASIPAIRRARQWWSLKAIALAFQCTHGLGKGWNFSSICFDSTTVRGHCQIRHQLMCCRVMVSSSLSMNYRMYILPKRRPSFSTNTTNDTNSLLPKTKPFHCWAEKFNS